MPFNRPTLQQLIDRVIADFDANIVGSDARVRASVLGVLSRVHAGAAHSMHGTLELLSKQILPDQASGSFLDRHGSLWGISRKPPSAAQGDVTCTGTDGVAITAGTKLTRSDGVIYVTDAVGTISGGSVDVAVTAEVAGEDGNATSGTVLTLTTPIAGVQSQAAVAAGGLTGGADTETDADLRNRITARTQRQPHGGAAGDYVDWALEVSGVTRAWVFPLQSGAGTVGVTFVVDDSSPIIPVGAKVSEVQAYIDALRPVTADVTVYAPTSVPLDLTIAVTPDTTEVRDAVEAELADLLRREGEPDSTLYLSRMREAISTAAGETDHQLVSPVADQVYTDTEIPTLGTITWQ